MPEYQYYSLVSVCLFIYGEILFGRNLRSYGIASYIIGILCGLMSFMLTIFSNG